jgi:hypothetical protein
MIAIQIRGTVWRSFFFFQFFFFFFFFCFKDIGRRPVSDFKRMRLPI